MSITLDVLHLGDVTVDRADVVKSREPGTSMIAPIYAFLLRGAQEKPILVDAGLRSAATFNRLGYATAQISEDQTLEAQLGRFGYGPVDVGMAILTHMHLDHAGLVDRLPMSTPVVVNRTEMAAAASGLEGFFYAPEDVHHMLDRIYTPGAAMLLDLDLSGPVEIAPGVVCEHLPAHTPGLMSVRAETDEGVARICGDVVYDIQDQLIEPINVLCAWEPQVTNHFVTALREEKAAVWRAMQGARFLLPAHDQGAVLEDGRVVGRVGDQIPGPVVPVEETMAGPTIDRD